MEEYLRREKDKIGRHLLIMLIAVLVGSMVTLTLLPILVPRLLPPVPDFHQFFGGGLIPYGELLDHQRTAVVAAVARVMPAVVGVTRYVHSRGAFRPALVPAGIGSGLIVEPSGYIVTNYHVVEDAVAVVVTLGDGAELEATVVGVDPGTDLALLKVAPLILCQWLNSATLTTWWWGNLS